MTDSEKLDLVLEKVIALDERVGRLEEKVDALDKRVGKLEEKVETLDKKVDVLNKRVGRLEKKAVRMESDVIFIKLTLENEIRVNIQRVAEGHLDLYRNLNECIALSHDVKSRQEIQDIYINMHHNQLKALEA